MRARQSLHRSYQNSCKHNIASMYVDALGMLLELSYFSPLNDQHDLNFVPIFIRLKDTRLANIIVFSAAMRRGCVSGQESSYVGQIFINMYLCEEILLNQNQVSLFQKMNFQQKSTCLHVLDAKRYTLVSSDRVRKSR